MKRHVVLVGLPGSGKTTVGRRVAQLLRVPFSDLDEMVVASAGLPVAEIFAAHGEPYFRKLERAAMDRALAKPPHVVAPGAGWIAEPGNLEAARGALLIYLEISAEAAAARLRGDNTRPLLAGGDAGARLQELLTKRGHWYRKAGTGVDGTQPIEVVAERIVRIVRDP